MTVGGRREGRAVPLDVSRETRNPWIQNLPCYATYDRSDRIDILFIEPPILIPEIEVYKSIFARKIIYGALVKLLGWGNLDGGYLDWMSRGERGGEGGGGSKERENPMRKGGDGVLGGVGWVEERRVVLDGWLVGWMVGGTVGGRAGSGKWEVAR